MDKTTTKRKHISYALLCWFIMKYNNESPIDKKNEMSYFPGLNIINIPKEKNLYMSYVCEDLGIQ